MINHIGGTPRLSNEDAVFADMNQDGVVNDLDLDLLVDAILGKSDLPTNLPLTRILDTSPANGEFGVSVTRETIIRFTQPLASNTVLTVARFYAEFGGRHILSRVDLSPDRRKASLFYLENLPGSARLNVTFDGTTFKDFAARFIDADGDGAPGGIAHFTFDTLSQTALSNTVVCGRIFASELAVGTNSGTNLSVNVPLQGVTVTADGLEQIVRAVSDQYGNFRLTNAPAGQFFVHIDGRTVTNFAAGIHYPDLAYYPFVGKLWESVPAGETNIGEVYLPLIAATTLRSVSQTQATVITFPTNVLAEHPELAGVTVTIPANALFSDNGTRGGNVGIAPVPPDRLPGPLPVGLTFPLVITVQTDGPQNFSEPVPVCFPNLPDPKTGVKIPPGGKTALWSFDHDLGKWVIRGSMTVSADGNLACSDPGVGLLSPGWHGAGPGSPGGSGGGDGGPGDGNPGGCPGAGGAGQSDCNPSVACCEKQPECPTNPVDPVTGEKYETATDLQIKGVGFDFVWQRTYRSRDGRTTAMGNNWDFSYNLSMLPDGLLLKVNEGTSRQYAFRQQADGKFARATQASEVKTNASGSFTMTMADGRTLEYQAFDGSPNQGKIGRMADRYGNTMRFFYDERGWLVRVNDTLNRDITIAHNSDGFIESVTDFTGRSVRYAYYADDDSGGSFGDLKSVTTPAVTGTPNTNDFPNGKTTVYTYTRGFANDRLNHNLLTITDGRRNDPNDPTFGQGPYLVNVYAPVTDTNDIRFDRVIRQYRGGDSVDLTYIPFEATLENNLVYMRTILRDRNGNVTEYDYQVSNLLVAQRHYTGRSATNQPVTATENRPAGKLRATDPDYFEARYEYNSNLLLARTVHPNGDITEMVYESDLNPTAPPRTRNNVRIKRHLPGSHLPAGDQSDIEELFEYDGGFAGGGGCGCGYNFVTKHTDARGHVLHNQYDAFGNLQARTNRITSVIENWEYNARGQMTRHVLPDNGSGHRRVDAMTYYDSGPMNGYLKEEIVDFGGFNLTTTYEYDAVGNVVKRIDPRGHDTQFVVNQLDQVVREISPEVTTGSGIRYRKDFAYDANNNLRSMDVENRDENGVLNSNAWLTTTFDYEILNKPVRKTEEVDAAHHVVTEYGYDANHNRTLTRWGEATAGRQTNNVMLVIYDERDLPFQEIRAPGSPEQSTTQFDYDANGNQIRVWHGLEDHPHLTTYAFDGYNRLVSTLDAMGNVTTNNFDATGNRTHTAVFGESNDMPGSAGNVRLSETTFNYDPMNRLTAQNVAFFNATNQAPIGSGFAVTQTLYNDNSTVFAMINANNHGSTNVYDAASRLAVRIDARGNSVTNTYDASGNLIRLTEVEKPDLGGPDELFITGMFYDNLNRPVATSNNVGSVNRSLYDSRGNRVATIDALTNRVLFTFDGLNRQTKTTRLMTDTGNGLGSVTGQIVTRQTWDDSSRLTSQIDDNGNATPYVYDGLNRKFATVFADGTGQTNVLDVHGSAILFTDGNGNRVTNNYDALDRLVRRDVGVGPGVSPDTTFEIYQYDGLSRMIHAEDNDSVLLRSYDSLSHVTQEIQNGAVVGARFDGVGNQTQLLYAGGRMVNTVFDELERIKTISDTNGMIATYNYVGPRRVARREYGNGTRCDYSYDGLTGIPNSTNDFGSRNIVRTRHTKVSDGTAIDDRVYGWDRMGNKTQHKDVRLGGPQVAKDIAYDSVYRMVRSARRPVVGAGETNAYAFDGVGNRLSVTGGDYAGAYTMSGTLPEPADRQVNQYTTTPFDGRAYDRDGNLKTVAGTNSQSMVFDYRSQLVEFNGGGAAGRYGYDALGRRVSRRVTGVLNEAVAYLYHGLRISDERDTNGSTSATYTFGVFIDEMLTVQRPGLTHFAHSDDLHSVFALSDTSGLKVETYSYEDYGQPLFFDSSGASTPVPVSGNVTLFTGRRFDPESKFYEYRTRNFDPRLGRFVSRDSIGVWGDLSNEGNSLTYAANNPFSKFDPLGTKCNPCETEDRCKICFENDTACKNDAYERYGRDVKRITDAKDKADEIAENYRKVGYAGCELKFQDSTDYASVIAVQICKRAIDASVNLVFGSTEAAYWGMIGEARLVYKLRLEVCSMRFEGCMKRCNCKIQ